MKPLTITIRAIRSFDRAIGWYAEVDTKTHDGVNERFFYRSSRRQVEKLVARLQDAIVLRGA